MTPEEKLEKDSQIKNILAWQVPIFGHILWDERFTKQHLKAYCGIYSLCRGKGFTEHWDEFFVDFLDMTIEEFHKCLEILTGYGLIHLEQHPEDDEIRRICLN